MNRDKMLSVAVGLLLLAATPAVAADEEPMGPIFPYETHVETLENGLKVILVPMSSNGLVAYWSIVRTGSRDEYEPGRSGFAHFFEHMMFRGTERFPAGAYNEITTKLGADINAFTTDDLTAYHLGLASEDLETVLDIESDRFRNLAYAEAEFRTEAGAVYGEYRKNRSNPFFQLYEAVQEAAFERHTYGHTTMGYLDDIKQMPEMYDYSLEFFDRYYRPDNVVLLIVGDVEPAETLERVRHYYGDWEAGYTAPVIQAEPEQKAERRVEVAYDGRSLPILWLGYKIDAFDPANREYMAARLLSELAFGSTSDLYKRLVLQQQSVEFVAADAGTNRDPGLLNIYTRIKDPGQVDAIRGEIEATIKRYQDSPPDAERLAALKSRLKYGFLMNLDTPDAVASGLARLIAVTGGIEVVDQMYETLDTITGEEVQAAARRYLVPERRTVAVLRGKS